MYTHVECSESCENGEVLVAARCYKGSSDGVFILPSSVDTAMDEVVAVNPGLLERTVAAQRFVRHCLNNFSEDSFEPDSVSMGLTKLQRHTRSNPHCIRQAIAAIA